MASKWSGLAAAWLLAGSLWAAPAGTELLIQTNVFTLGRTETLAAPLAVLANNIALAGEARDDLFLMATPAAVWGEAAPDGLIELSGVFHNDVWALGNNIVLTGLILDHARFLTLRTITIHGSIANASLFLGNTVHLTRSADLTADAWLAGENLIVEGWVQGNLTLIGQNVTLAGTVGQNVKVVAQDFMALPGAEIMGDLVYSCPKEFVPDPRVVVHGRIIRESLSETSPDRSLGVLLSSILLQFGLFLGALLAGMFCAILLPAFTARAVHQLRDSPWICLATGIMSLGLTPLIVLVAVLSVIGIPLGLLLLGGMAILIYLAKITAGISLGLWLLRRPEPRSLGQYLLPLIVGLLCIYAGVNSGLFGLAVWLVVTAAGLGSMLQACLPPPANRPPPVNPPHPAGQAP